MVTVSTPSGTPSVVYNRDGVTIDTLAAAGSNQATAAPIIRYSGHTVVVVSISAASQGVMLPSNAEIGDLVEIHCDNSFNSFAPFFLYPESGAKLGYSYAVNGHAQAGTADHGFLFRRISAGQWSQISYLP